MRTPPRLWVGLGFLLLGATASAAPLTPITRGTRTKPLVALTFDACETRKPTGYDARIVQALKDTHTPATFFLCGRWMETHPQETKQLAQEPLFELGNHSYLHPHLTRLTEAQIREELAKTQAVMQRLTGKQGRLFRPPYGEYDDRVLQAANELGLTSVKWEVVSGDPDPHVTAPLMIETVTHRTRNGSIIIMHVNGRGWHTAEALPEILRRLRQKGYRFVTVSELLKEDARK